ncbi:hypothetical protein B7486_55700, partial [cyanobacterium TDX16]
MRPPRTPGPLGKPRHRAAAVALATAAATGPIALITAAPAQAGPPAPYVVTTTDDVLEAPDAAISLREAVTLANEDGAASHIHLQAGATYELDLCDAGAPDESGNLSGDLDHDAAGEALTIAGFGATIRQTCSGERVLNALHPASQLTLVNTTITGGRTATTGGGVFSNGPLSLIAGSVEGNVGGGAGGGGVASFFDVVVNGTTFRDNATSGHGGGVFANEEAIVHGSTLVDNRAAQDGGGVYGGDGVAVQRSTITRNIAFGAGGGVRSIADLELRGSTVVANLAVTGANLRADDELAYLGSVVALGRGGSDCIASVLDSDDGNVGMDASCGPFEGDDEPDVHPQLGALGDNGGDTDTMRPVVGSPTVDRYLYAGPSCATAQDQRIVDRPQGPGCDSGAYEGPPAACAPTFPDVSAAHPFFA